MNSTQYCTSTFTIILPIVTSLSSYYSHEYGIEVFVEQMSFLGIVVTRALSFAACVSKRQSMVSSYTWRRYKFTAWIYVMSHEQND